LAQTSCLTPAADHVPELLLQRVHVYLREKGAMQSNRCHPFVPQMKRCHPFH
jgi:hypothetical protein